MLQWFFKRSNFLSENNIELKRGKLPHKGPLTHGYKPDMEFTYECDADDMSWFQQRIGILISTVELGRIDIQI